MEFDIDRSFQGDLFSDLEAGSKRRHERIKQEELEMSQDMDWAEEWMYEQDQKRLVNRFWSKVFDVFDFLTFHRI
jgi:hypothetical protein